MKAVIFAGGLGTRLGNRTSLLPKPMIKIGEKPILWHIMKIYSSYGIKQFIICLGYQGDVIKDYFLNYDLINNDFTVRLGDKKTIFHTDRTETDWEVTLVDTGVRTLKGARLKRVEHYLDGDCNLLTYGDGVADLSIKELISFHRSHGKTVTITGVYPPARFGELIAENNLVKSFQEKPQTSQGLINGGFMVFNQELFQYLTTEQDCDLEVGVLENLAKRGKVMVYQHAGNWECMDNERDVKHLNQLWREDQAFWKVW